MNKKQHDYNMICYNVQKTHYLVVRMHNLQKMMPMQLLLLCTHFQLRD